MKRKEKTVKKHEDDYIHISKKFLWILSPFLIVMPAIYVLVAIAGGISKIIIIPIISFIMGLIAISGGDKNSKNMAKELFTPNKDMFKLMFGWNE